MNWEILKLSNITFNVKIQITRLKPRRTLWWYYFPSTGELIVFTEKFLVVKCWICLPSPPIKNLQKFFLTYKPVTPFRKRSHSAPYLILLQLHKHTQIIMIMFSLLHRCEDHTYHFFVADRHDAGRSLADAEQYTNA